MSAMMQGGGQSVAAVKRSLLRSTERARPTAEMKTLREAVQRCRRDVGVDLAGRTEVGHRFNILFASNGFVSIALLSELHT